MSFNSLKKFISIPNLLSLVISFVSNLVIFDFKLAIELPLFEIDEFCFDSKDLYASLRSTDNKPVTGSLD